MSAEFNCQIKFYFKLFSFVKQSLIHTIQFSINIVFLQTELNVKQFYFKQFILALVLFQYQKQSNFR